MNKLGKTLLVVEDDPGLQKALRWAFSDFEVVTAGDRKSAIAQLRRHEPQVVTLDLGLPPDPGSASEGLATLQEILALAPDIKVIVVTGNNDHENAVRAIGLGAWLFFQKPVDAELLGVIVERAYNLFELEQENRELSRQEIREPMAGIIATSPQMLDACRTVEKVAPTDATTPRCCWGKAGLARNYWPVHCMTSVLGLKSVLSRSIVPPYPIPCWKASCSAMKKGLSPVR